MPAILQVSEVFDSIQGEGQETGYQTTFLRLAGCNLSCVWCDTKYAQTGGQETDIPSIVAKCGPRVCITGGEPLTQDIEHLVVALTQGHSIAVETNGSIMPPEWARNRTVGAYSATGGMLWSVAPKFGSSGETPDVVTLQAFAHLPRVQFKFVVSGEDDWQEAQALARQINVRDNPVFVVPNGQDAVELTRHFWDRMGEWSWCDARLTPQLHVLVWGQERCR